MGKEHFANDHVGSVTAKLSQPMLTSNVTRWQLKKAYVPQAN